MDIVFKQPVKELLQFSAFFKEKIIVLVDNSSEEALAKKKGLVPCYLVDEKTDLNKLKGKKKAVLGGSVGRNEFAVKIKANFLLQPSNIKQFFDLGLAKKLFDNNTIVVLLFDELLEKNSFERHLFWKNYLEVVKHCNKKKTKFFVASGCKTYFDLKHPKMRSCLSELLGYDKKLFDFEEEVL